jgi:hypothetical protein
LPNLQTFVVTIDIGHYDSFQDLIDYDFSKPFRTTLLPQKFELLQNIKYLPKSPIGNFILNSLNLKIFPQWESHPRTYEPLKTSLTWIKDNCLNSFWV